MPKICIARICAMSCRLNESVKISPKTPEIRSKAIHSAQLTRWTYARSGLRCSHTRMGSMITICVPGTIATFGSKTEQPISAERWIVITAIWSAKFSWYLPYKEGGLVVSV